jgi:aromatic-L-amino-acid/L-tryptophan decarboxylase
MKFKLPVSYTSVMTTDEFRTLGHELIDFIANYRDQIETLPVISSLKPGEVSAQFAASAPEKGDHLEGLVSDLEKLKPALTHFQHPRYFAYFPANSSLEGVLGDLVSSGLGQLGLNWQSSPLLTELEEVTTDWMRQALGLSEAWQGVIQDTASSTSMLALICARERTSAYSLNGGGLQAQARPLKVYVSSQAHSSIDKAALLAGFGRENLQIVDVDENHAMKPEALEAAIQKDLELGNAPCAIVASIGTTTSTAFDPLEAISRVAAKYGVWLHVDAAMAGSAMILPECRFLWQGVEGADSIVLNPHKWLGVTFDCTLYYVRDSQHLVRVMSTNPSYLQTSQDGQAKNYRDWGIPLGRRARAFKLWFLIRSVGLEGLRARLRRDMANAQWLAAQVDAEPNWVRLAPVPLQTVCVRHEPVGLSGEALERHTLAWVERINTSGFAYLTPAKLEGRWMVRVSIGALPTELEHVQALWEKMKLEVENG